MESSPRNSLREIKEEAIKPEERDAYSSHCESSSSPSVTDKENTSKPDTLIGSLHNHMISHVKRDKTASILNNLTELQRTLLGNWHLIEAFKI